MPCRETIAIPPEVVRELLVFVEEIAGVEIRCWSAVEDAFAEVLGQTGAEVEERGTRFQAGEDGGGVERVFGETEGEEPEFADAGPGEDAPGFVSLERCV